MPLGVIFVIAVALRATSSYNRLVSLRNQALNGCRQIDLQPKRRHEVIPNLVNAVRGSMDFERDTPTAVIGARATALGATGPADAAQKESQCLQRHRDQLQHGAAGVPGGADRRARGSGFSEEFP